MQKLTIDAPAKINLHLRVKARRPDGFHDLESIFAALAFGDTLRFEPLAGDGKLEITMEGRALALPADLPAEKNLVFKAVSLFRNKTGYNQGLRVQVEKRIPPGGGLGGGSSDAASTLIALNSLSGGLLSPDSLAEMAAVLGSDVPFFLTETGAAWVSGRGEQVKPISVPQTLFFVLVKAGFSSDTAAAFRLLDEFRADNPVKSAVGPAESVLLRALVEHPRAWPFENDFLPVFIHNASQNPNIVSAFGTYQEILRDLRDLEADFTGLSGSGAACFGVFTDRNKAARAEKTLTKYWNFVKFTILLAHKPLAVLEYMV